ncbi:YSC84-related protein [Verrucomicrobium sp. 3C]|uniref:YSC84-related protein n=1 Tax=Verrucomicrobium sp. 3C TaxID=1134055 RepID=UPI00037FC70E|nr:YSC84-related protein [Verrucomicrobium sp. 3C]
MKVRGAVGILGVILLWSGFGIENARAWNLQDSVVQSAEIIRRFKSLPEGGIPEAVFGDAKGLAILTVIKAGFLVSARGGRGLVIGRTGQGWSGPSAVATGGLGFGLQIGAEVTEFVLVLNTPEAIQAFARGGNVTLGGDISAAAGPVGRTAEGAVTPFAAVYTYSRSQGIFGGLSLEGTVIAEAPETNREYYGREVNPEDILAGKIQPPARAKILVQALEKPYNRGDFSKKPATQDQAPSAEHPGDFSPAN